MNGVHPPRCVEWRWCVLLLSCPVQWRGSYPTHPTAVLASTAVMLCTVPCRVLWCVGGECVSVMFVWWGILCVLPPLRCGGWGHRGRWGAVVVVGGMMREGRRCCRLPVECRRPPSACWRPPPLVVYPVALLNGGRGAAVMPRLRIRSGTSRCPVPLALHSLVSCCPLPLCVAVVCAVCGEREGGVCGVRCVWFHCERCIPLPPPFRLRVRCRSIVGSVLCLCGRVVSLWNSGDDLCWVEGRAVSTVCCVLRCAFQCAVWVVEWRRRQGGVVLSFPFLSALSSSPSSLCWCSG